MNAETVTASELYIDHKAYAAAYENARKAEISDEDIGNTQAIRDILEVIEMDVAVTDHIPENQDYIQEILLIKANTVQEGILKYKIGIKNMRVGGALARLNICNVLASEAFRLQGDKWHQEALDMNSSPKD